MCGKKTDFSLDVSGKRCIFAFGITRIKQKLKQEINQMKNPLLRICLLFALVACGSIVKAQLPNEKFGKPSDLEWEYKGWGDAIDADAIVLCKTMKVTYELTDQFGSMTENVTELNADNMQFLGNNRIDESGIIVNYEIKLRTKILKSEGAKHANIDITYCDGDLAKNNNNFDEMTDLKVRVFTKNEKGKVEKKNINTSNFTKERIDDNYVVLHVVVPDVQPGSIIEYNYKIRSPRATFLFDWAFQESIPTLHSKCDLEIPAFLKFNMNVPINKLIKSNVEAGMLTYDQNRSDMKAAKRCRTNHYTIVGDNILPEGQPITHNQGTDDTKEQVKIANFTSQITEREQPAYLPDGVTHLKIK